MLRLTLIKTYRLPMYNHRRAIVRYHDNKKRENKNDTWIGMLFSSSLLSLSLYIVYLSHTEWMRVDNEECVVSD